MSSQEPQENHITPSDEGARGARSRLLHRELERRLEFFDDTDESVFGRFTTADWVLCTILFFVLPLVIAWLAR